MTRAHAFIFDIDCSIVDFLHDVADALNGALAELQRRQVPPKQVRCWTGDDSPTLCQRATADADPNALADLIQLAGQNRESPCTDNSRRYPKVLQTLNLLKNRGAPMAILPNKPHPLAMQPGDELSPNRYVVDVRRLRKRA